jgi:ketosteroid isomerase-like protein
VIERIVSATTPNNTLGGRTTSEKLPEGPGFGTGRRIRGESMDNVGVVKSLYDAFGRGDIPSVLGAMSAEIRWYQAESNPYRPSGEAWVGPDSVLNNLFMRLGTEWDDFAVHPRSFHGAGGSVIVEARYSGTYKPTGKSMDAQVCHVWDIKDGKLIRFQQYVDTAKLHDVMGLR